MITKSLLCHGSVLALAALVASGLTACSGSSETRSPSVQQDERSGQIGMDLTIGGGVVLASVHYKVSGNGIVPVEGDIPVDASGATASLLLRLPAGNGYSVTFSATDTTGATSCSGTATFNVTAGQTNGVTVPLICGTLTTRGNETFNGTFNTCAEITQLVIAPLQLDVGGKINVSATATDVDNNPLTYAWTATGGSFDAATSATTKYLCSAAGHQTLTISVSDGQGCVTALTADVNCTSAAICGNGVLEAGEGCEPTPGAVSTTGSATCRGPNESQPCQLRVQTCGDGFVQGTETCEPPNTATCDAQCHRIVCGDGVVSSGEGCEPPNTATCTGTCQIRPPLCGDTFVTPPETCEPPGTATCDTTCHTIDACTSCTTLNCSDLATGCTAVAGCDAVLACIVSTGCAKNSTRDSKECYCGSVDDATCFGFNPNAPQGLCKAVMDAAAPGGPLAVGAVYFDTSSPVGAAVQETGCRRGFCQTPCNL